VPKVIPELDLDADPGERLAPEMRAEIREIAPSAVQDGDITERKIRDEAVTRAKIAPGAVDSTRISAGGVVAANLAAKAVTTEKLEEGAVTGAKTGPGVLTVTDSAGNPIRLTAVTVTAAEYAALGASPPGNLYLIVD